MLTLIRELEFGSDAAGGIAGRLYCNGQFICYTLENSAKAIPTGRYAVANSKSPRFGRELPLISNEKVKASRGIRIHCGNAYTASEGCVLVEMGWDPKACKLLESRLAETMVAMLCRNDSELVIAAI